MLKNKNDSKKLYTHLPSCPGVYLMKNADGGIIYIGKSNNLRARVRSYFVAGASLNFAKKKMIHHIDRIDFIETKTDIEALLLETNLIKTHQPKYNVLMKDGKNVSYLKITDDEIPCLVRTRFKNPNTKSADGKLKIENGKFFGPYSQYFDTYSYLRFVRKLFKLGNHDSLKEIQRTKYKGQNKKALTINDKRLTINGHAPCLDTYIGLCPGHCTGDPEKIAIYLARLEQAKDFLEGNVDGVLRDLRTKMVEAARKREFEQAAEYKSQIAQIEETGNRQIVRDSIDGDAIVITSLLKYEKQFLAVVEIKNGGIIGVMEYALDNPLAEAPADILAQAVIQILEKHAPHLIMLSTELATNHDISSFTEERKIRVREPKRGEKVQILEFAQTNLLNFAFREVMSGLRNATLSKKTMESLLNILSLPLSPSKGGGMPPLKTTRRKPTLSEADRGMLIFECFDISHSHGEHTVASKSVLVNGKPDPKRYRKYRIKTLKTGQIDDFASIEEVMMRRTFAALKNEDPWPDLIIIDGGKGQLSAAIGAISGVVEKWKSGKENVVSMLKNSSPIQPFSYSTIPPIISLAKREEEVFLPGQSEPILLEKGSPELMLLQKIRDEAHRFAINYNRTSREKSYTKTLLDELPGIGPSARKKILSHVSRIEELSKWNPEKAEKIFGKKITTILVDHGLLAGDE